MKYSFLSSIFGPTIIVVGSLVTGALIAELTDTNTFMSTYKQAVVTAKKLDVNDDGFISFDELTNRQEPALSKAGPQGG